MGKGVARPAEGSGFFLDVLGKLAMVVALILVCAALWRKFHSSQPLGGAVSPLGMQVVSTLPLGPQRYVHVVAVGRRNYLIGSSAQNVTFLANLDDAAGAQGGYPAHASSYATSAYGALDAQSDAGADGSWSEGAPDAGDRFEEMLLRLRRLEAEQTARGRHDAGAIEDDPYRGRTGTPPNKLLPERRAPATRDSRRADDGAPDARALAPGDLFRSASDGPRGGRYA